MLSPLTDSWYLFSAFPSAGQDADAMSGFVVAFLVVRKKLAVLRDLGQGQSSLNWGAGKLYFHILLGCHSIVQQLKRPSG